MAKEVIFNRLNTHDNAIEHAENSANTIFFTQKVSGNSEENHTIIINGEEYGREVPLGKGELPYTETVDGGVDALVQRQFMRDGSDGKEKIYVVDNQKDFDLCEEKLSGNDTTSLILRTDDNTVWEYSNGEWAKKVGKTPSNYFFGSHQSYNDITKKLWYSNGTQIYELLTGGGEVPRKEHELIYYSEDEYSNKYSGLITQQLMYEDGIVVDNQEDFEKCTEIKEKPDIQDTFWQFTVSPLSPEYGKGLSTSQSEHTTPTYVHNYGTLGYGYNTWGTLGGNNKNVVYTALNSQEFNGYVYNEKSRNFIVESLIGSYKRRTTGDVEGVTLLNTNHAKRRHVITSDNVIFERDAMFDKVVNGTNQNAWVHKDGRGGAYVIYSGCITATTGDSFWTSKLNSSTLDIRNVDNNDTIYFCGISNTGGTTANLSELYVDDFPTGTGNTLYYTNDITTKNGRTNTLAVPDKTVEIKEEHEASGYIAALNILIENTSDINALIGNNSSGFCETVIAWAEILPITVDASFDSGSTTFDSGSTTDNINRNAFGYLQAGTRTTANKDPYGISAYVNQRRYLFTHARRNGITQSVDNYGGENLVKYVVDFNQDSDTGDANTSVAIMNKVTFNNGKLTIDFSQVGGITGNTSGISVFSGITNFKDINGDDLEYKTHLTFDFNNKTYSLSGFNLNDEYNPLVFTDEPIKIYKDVQGINQSGTTELTGSDKYNVWVYEDDESIKKDILSLFCEDVEFMYLTCSLQYHALNCMLLSFNDRLVLRSDQNNVWELNEEKTEYVPYHEDKTALELFTGSRLNYNDITEKLWYSNGKKIYQIATSNQIETSNVMSYTGGESAVTINYNTNKYVKITNPSTPLTITVDTVSGTSTGVKNIVVRIDSPENRDTLVKVIAANGVSKLINMFDISITGGGGYVVSQNCSLELVFTFWSPDDISFNGGTNASLQQLA